jgi:succinate dehydrogenase/fumarate reductase flavoprotein subunit
MANKQARRKALVLIKDSMEKNMEKTISVNGYDIPVRKVHTLIIGSGAAGLNTAVQLHAKGISDLLIISEGLKMGTSINTGSDKQTYYKLGMYGSDPDSPESLAKSFFDGGSMHGDLALIEANQSAGAFLNLVNLGVPFPKDRYGQFVGYKTDHDPLQRATSVGPYTSKKMCEELIAEVNRRNIEVLEKRNAVKLLTIEDNGEKRACGTVTFNKGASSQGEAFEAFIAENVIFAVGGPGGLYKTSVYPSVHTGAIGLALLEGAKAQSLPESQYGMASIKFRWNVSGTYMQVIPRFISTDKDGVSNEEEFLLPYFKNAGEMNSAIFLKGYQWPFDPRKVVGGSSIVDILVYIETVLKGRRVFLDYRKNGKDFDFDALSEESRTYLKNSNALLESPIARLEKMNEPAIQLYLDHNIDIRKEPLEIAVCAQHNNGGLAGNIWWESLNIKHLFPVGEVNGSHGVYRPGGSALNSGQVAGFRASEYIAAKYREFTIDNLNCEDLIKESVKELADWLKQAQGAEKDWQSERDEFQSRMSKAGAHIRSESILEEACGEAWKQWERLQKNGCKFSNLPGACESLRNLQLCFAHAVYLEALRFLIKSKVGSRGSALVTDANGIKAHPDLDDNWKFAEENPEFREKVMETTVLDAGKISNKWIERRPIPVSDAWFENTWAEFRNGKIYD